MGGSGRAEVDGAETWQDREITAPVPASKWRTLYSWIHWICLAILLIINYLTQEFIIKDSIIDHINVNDFLNESQHGFVS